MADGIFEQWYYLTDVYIPPSIERLGLRCFTICVELKNVTFLHPSSSRLQIVREQAFVACRELQSIELPDTTTEICDNTFENCLSLMNVTLPKCSSRYLIGTFDTWCLLQHIVLANSGHCINLKIVFVSNALQKIGDDAFLYCIEL